MSDNANQPDSISIDEIDFSKYRTKELASEIGDLLGLPKSLLQLVGYVLMCVLLGVIGVYILMKIDGQNGLTTFATGVYTVVASLLFAIALWIVMMLKKGVTSLTQIVDLLLATTTQIAQDYRELHRGAKKLPPMADLVGAVYEHVFMHAFRQGISSATGFFGKPIYWIYRMTVDRMLKKVVRFVATRTASEQSKADLKDLIDSSMPEIAAKESAIISHLQWARENIVQSGNWLSRRMLWPCYFVIAVFFTLLIAPIVAVLILI